MQEAGLAFEVEPADIERADPMENLLLVLYLYQARSPQQQLR